jgi:MEDS: MEthanogen/methylotroph, DcmR Sensory domain
MRAIGRPIRVAGGTLGRDCHICAFFNGPDEEHRVLRSFIKDGIDVGEKSFHIVDPKEKDDHLTRCAPGRKRTSREVVSSRTRCCT